MPRQHGTEMPDGRQPSAVIHVLKSSAMNKPKRCWDGPIFKKDRSSSNHEPKNKAAIAAE